MKKFIITYFFFLVFLLSFFVSGFIDSQDGLQYLAVARNIYYTHEPTAPVYEFTGGPGVGKNIHLSTHVGKDGKTYSATGLGFSLALLPAVAITDAAYRLYRITPAVHFPLENDWLIFLTASFTNIFFAAGIGTLIYIYLREVGVKHRSAIIISLIGILTTNLFVASKHIYAHTMFTFFLFFSFMLLKLYTRNKKNAFLFLSGASWGIAILTYNISFLIPIIPYIVYIIMLKIKKNRSIFFIIIGVLPFFLLNNWYTNLTSIPTITAASDFLGNALKTPIGVIYEGLYGQLLSPGRSYFIYSPILLIPLIFWFKIKKDILPETLVFIFTLGLYVIASSLAWSPHYLGFAEPLWHGEYSWGPRYLIPSIPFGIVLVGYIYEKITKIQKRIIFVPLVIIGLYVEILGITMHYQLKFYNLEPSFTVNRIQFAAPIYTNLLPRFSPLLTMSKILVNLVKSFPKTFDNGRYNVQFIDGIDFAFNVGPERWRTIDKIGYITFDNYPNDPVSSLTLELINHPIDDTLEDSSINFYINNEKITTTQTLKIGERRKIILKPSSSIIKEKGNILIINVDQKDYISYFDKKQVTAIINMSINNNSINLESINVPYISSLGPTIGKIKYQNWGNNSNPWITWNIHTQVVERTPFFWWLYPLYYWDIPQRPYFILFLINTFGIIYFTKRLVI